MLSESSRLVSLLRTCAKQKQLSEGINLHADICRQGLLEKNNYVGSNLVNMYLCCGNFVKAQEVFDELPLRNVICWNILISGYAHHGRSQEAVECFEQMQCEGLIADVVTFTCILKVYGSVRSHKNGIKVHADIARRGLLAEDVLLGTALVDMYAKCGTLEAAQQVFDELTTRNAVSWNTIIVGYAQHKCGEEALKCYKQMRIEGLSPDAVTFSCIAKACGSVRRSQIGTEVHADVVKEGLLQKDVLLGTALVDMYAKCGALARAQQLFDELPAVDVVAWNALIAGYAQEDCFDQVLTCFECMQGKGFSPNAATFANIIKACGNLGVLDKGAEIHAEIVKKGLVKTDTSLDAALIDMYIKCGVLAQAWQVFEETSIRNVVDWSALIAGYAQYGYGEEALSCYNLMQLEGMPPNAVTFTNMLKVCGIMKAVKKGEEIHAKIVEEGFLEHDMIISTALVDMYVKCGALGQAKQVFDDLPDRSLACWNVLISGYAQHECGGEAVRHLEQMQREGLFPDTITFACLIKACSSTGATDIGKIVHGEIVREGLLQHCPLLGNALVDMYAKCGALVNAAKVFSKLLVRDVYTWTALITGYAQLGDTTSAFNLFGKMVAAGVEPDFVSFTALLSAFSYSGLVDEGYVFFMGMITCYHMIPTLEHHICIVDLFARAGYFNKVLAFLDRMPSCDYPLIWTALLGACQKWENVKLGNLAFQHAVQLDVTCTATYICMSNVLAAAGMQDDDNTGAWLTSEFVC